MAKKKTKKISDVDFSALKGLGDQISGITNSLEEQLKPLMDLTNLESEIEKLKNSYKTASDVVKEATENKEEETPYPDKEGETCMHDNAWYSNCSECDAFDMVDIMLDAVATTPNDEELGKKIRDFASQIIEMSELNDYPYNIEFSGDKTKKEMDDMQLNLFEDNKEQLNLFDLTDDPATKDRKRWGG